MLMDFKVYDKNLGLVFCAEVIIKDKMQGLFCSGGGC